MKAMVLAIALLWPVPTEAVSTRCDMGRTCSLSITFTGTSVASTALQVEAHDGVLVAKWQTSGSPDAASGERWAFYSADVLAVNLTLEPDGNLTGTATGGLLAWAGEPTMLARR